MATGNDIVDLAEKRIGERYVLGARAPKDNASWKGPWDCAEFTSWLVYQVSTRLYGCVDNGADPDKADAYTGAWRRDGRRLGSEIPVAQAATIPGAFVLRASSQERRIGHIVVSDGKGGTIEAASANMGVCARALSGRTWDVGILVPWITYAAPGPAVAIAPPAGRVLRQGMSGPDVEKVQKALAKEGFDPGPIDGIFGGKTKAAVYAFQIAKGLTADAIVGPNTLASLGLQLP